ncbi:ATP-binding cassette sub-family D member 3 [Drosophila teissieri]|uniref:ATP-binding cassette sub-family D member 3 n=1 Tax=Drosophila yakuba TaxID=7245 RepID=B4PYZ9_DROYA|nr:ATP-binding cassette sub-family D member 3 [Drosophila yakuba]XP_039232721.1 ATP-binding cassette sub-family D member 3 [Drosophila yakuba]XP_039232724.1 ATP-binding cassette sub-family D member 3 [Drosophila yakuba]XP_039498335.1 ATP-binding cassette sub-family D member 3 [Drosophila santomea]XP_039498336.1 ATP-binding cassette sub-family D member 3 [Drosophila santomea]XP_043659083.1 ATP-binding cassette sub-family D member 3 [Drosophila teissieri]XP_043659084.1 ATP-binding cassette sub-
MAPALSKLANNQSAIVGVAGMTAAIWIIAYGKMSNKKRKPGYEDKIQYTIAEKKEKKAAKAHVNSVFFKQLRQLLPILIPGFWSIETGLLFLVAAALIGRSVSDIWMIQNATVVESTIIHMNRTKFKTALLKYLTALPAISVVTNVLKWSLGELKLRFRTNLTHHLYSQYLNGYTYYKMSNLDNRIANADQLLTTDIDKFCESATDLYSNISKPVLDIFIYVYRLTVNLGGKTPSILMLYLLFAGVFLTRLRRPTGRLTVEEQKLEGEFRYVNSRLITNSEEVAFYQGNVREKLTLLASYSKLRSHLRKFLEFRVSMGIIDNIIGKYFASIVGFYAVSIPFFSENHPLLSGEQSGQRLQAYYTYGRMLVKLAEAIGRLVLAGREMSRLAGFTARMTELIKVLSDLNKGTYERTMVNGNNLAQNAVGSASSNFGPNKGIMCFEDNIIRFEKVPLVTPNGDVLLQELTFEVKSGTNVLVCGPNGCGKSSLFRILGELWPTWGGKVTKPSRGKLFYVPQRPYMTLGTLRDQIIYPHTRDDMRRLGHSDEDLMHYLDIVQLTYLEQRENGLDAIEDWIDVLSGGEKQRIAMARLFYHKPQFAILDECTSAVSVDVEGKMYSYCREVGITLFTVSHRKSLWAHHDYYLQFDGRGSYEFATIDQDKDHFGS